jgi:hypothetical protein
MSAPKADIAERDWHVRFVPKADIAKSKSNAVSASLCQRLIREKCEELQCDSRNATFSTANKAEAVSAECNLLVWNGISTALFLGNLQTTQAFPNIPSEGAVCS